MATFTLKQLLKQTSNSIYKVKFITIWRTFDIAVCDHVTSLNNNLYIQVPAMVIRVFHKSPKQEGGVKPENAT